jgi:hypothetical protein
MKWLSLLSISILAACASIADAGTLTDVVIIDRTTGQQLPIYRHQGRIYVEGKVGDRYGVQIKNRTEARILTLISVDGVNAVSGETAATSQSGYVLGPWQSADINGWRKSMRDVAAFYFTSIPDSYAARTGRPDNVGVIGIATFTEYIQPPPIPAPSISGGRMREDVVARLATNRATGTQEAPASAVAEGAVAGKQRKEDKVATGHGERIYAPTRNTEFRRASTIPNEVISIYYDSRANLIAMGVIPVRPRLAQPFPNSAFVPDPS